MDAIVQQTHAAISDAKAHGDVLAQDSEEARIAEIAAQGPRGAIVLGAVSVVFLLAIWLAFYFFIFLPRGTIG